MTRYDDKIVFGVTTSAQTSADDSGTPPAITRFGSDRKVMADDYLSPLKDPGGDTEASALAARSDDLLDGRLVGYTAADDLWEW